MIYFEGFFGVDEFLGMRHFVRIEVVDPRERIETGKRAKIQMVIQLGVYKVYMH